jgi:hypothetical protein
VKLIGSAVKTEAPKPYLHEIAPGSVVEDSKGLWLVGPKVSDAAGISVTNLDTGEQIAWNKFTRDFTLRSDIALTVVTNCKSLWPDFTR